MQSMTTQPTRQHRRGRPRVSDVDRRRIKVSINLNLAEAEQLSLKSEEAGMECASYIRVAALGNGITAVPAINRDAYINLSKLASNLNQLMRAINSGSAGIISGDQLGSAVAQLRSEVQALRSALLGG
jgi:hypothetical protein